jgi:hypothetical protein
VIAALSKGSSARQFLGLWFKQTCLGRRQDHINGDRAGVSPPEFTQVMKLFFAVLFVVLATGFISFMTLSLAQAVHRNPDAFKPLHSGEAQPSH